MNNNTLLNNNLNYDDPLVILINYFRYLTNANIELQTFKTGYEWDENIINDTELPILFFSFPINSTYNEPLSPEEGFITYNFNIYIYNNSFLLNEDKDDKVAMNKVVNIHNLNYINNQNEVTDVIKRDSIEIRCNRLANIINTKFLKDLQIKRGLPIIIDGKDSKRVIPAIINYSNIETSQYETTALMAKSTIQISISFGNSYYCNIEDNFKF